MAIGRKVPSLRTWRVLQVLAALGSAPAMASTVCDGAAGFYQTLACCGDTAETEAACVAKSIDGELTTAIQAVSHLSNALFIGSTDAGASKNLAAKRGAALATVGSVPARLSMQGEFYDNLTYTDAAGVMYYPWLFSKTLPHDPATGFCRKSDVDALLALLAKDPSELSPATVDVVAAGLDPPGRKLELPFGGRGENLIGGSPRHTFFEPANVKSTRVLFDMMETYAMSLFRDVPIANWEDSADMQLFLNFMNTLDNDAPKNAEGVIDKSTAFRGRGPDETLGGYVSQFMLQGFNYGNIRVEQLFSTEMDAPETVTASGWLAMQNGISPMPTAKGTPVYTSSMRVIGAKVHNDPLYQFYYDAALIALQCGVGTSGGPGSSRVSSWTDGGGPMVLWAVAAVSRGALQTAWWHKWNAHMRVRPEVLAQRLHLCATDNTLCQAIGLSTRFSSIPLTVLQKISDHNDAATGSTSAPGLNLRLLLQYPEGSPTHPAWPAGHATVAGACVTVLKALLKTLEDGTHARRLWPTGSCPVVEAATDGNTLNNVEPPDAITIVGELNKLASNAALGRNMAGVHYRSDGDEGLVLGEQHAITFLQQILNEVSLRAQYDEFVLSKFDGTVVRITATSVVAVA